jgi:hypothetical protein
MKKYRFSLSDTTTMDLDSELEESEIKNLISTEKWIILKTSRYGEMVDREVQTCNIIYFHRDIETENYLKSLIEEDREQLELIKKIRSYRHDFRMRYYFWWRGVKYINANTDSLMNFNNDFLKDILARCEKRLKKGV